MTRVMTMLAFWQMRNAVRTTFTDYRKLVPLVAILFFIGMQVYEFQHFYHKGLTMQKNLFGASFFTLTGFHGTHVTIGVIWLLTMFIELVRGHVPPSKALNLETAALYWHFVDVVWIVIFPVVYLMN